MTIAPLPDHNRITDPWWQELFRRYSHIISPLRERGLITDMEMCGGEYLIECELPDDGRLSIASETSLPANPAEVTSWVVLHHHTDTSDTPTVVYDSTPGSKNADNGSLWAPFITTIDTYLNERGLLPAGAPRALLPIICGATQTATGLKPLSGLASSSHSVALEEYDHLATGLTAYGWRLKFEHACKQWPYSTWVRGDETRTIFLTLEDVASTEDDHDAERDAAAPDPDGDRATEAVD